METVANCGVKHRNLVSFNQRPINRPFNAPLHQQRLICLVKDITVAMNCRKNSTIFFGQPEYGS